MVNSNLNLFVVVERFPETNVIARRLWAYNYRSAEERTYICRIPSATKKYELFLKNYSHLAGRIPLKYIASFPGMTLENPEPYPQPPK